MCHIGLRQIGDFLDQFGSFRTETELLNVPFGANLTQFRANPVIPGVYTERDREDTRL